MGSGLYIFILSVLTALCIFSANILTLVTANFAWYGLHLQVVHARCVKSKNKFGKGLETFSNTYSEIGDWFVK